MASKTTAANYIEAVEVSNPYNVTDTCSHLRLSERKTLKITECMPYVSQYTLHFWIRGTVGNTVSFSCQNVTSKIRISSAWQEFSKTFTITAISDLRFTFPRGEYWIYNMKLEVGDTVTDWSPHPEDDLGVYDSRFSGLEKTIASTVSETGKTQSTVDEVNQVIQDLISKDEFEGAVKGLENDFTNNLEVLTRGKNRWKVATYNKADFVNIEVTTKISQTLNPSEDTPNTPDTAGDEPDTDPIIDEPDTGGVVEVEPDDEDDPFVIHGYRWLDELYPADADPDIVDPLTPRDKSVDVETKKLVDMKDCNISIFALNNASIRPVSETVVDDNEIAMRLPYEGKVLLYTTFAYFDEDTSISVNCHYCQGTIYVNGLSVFEYVNPASERDIGYKSEDSTNNDAPRKTHSDRYIGTLPVTLKFTKGWNIIELIANEGNFSFSKNISEHEKCSIFNCLIAAPTERSIKVRSRSNSFVRTLDSTISTIRDAGYIIDEHGKRIYDAESKVVQTARMVAWLLMEDGQEVGSLKLTNRALKAVTKQFVIVDPDTGKAAVIKNGTIQANSITASVLHTESIVSRDFGFTLDEDDPRTEIFEKYDDITVIPTKLNAVLGDEDFRGSIFTTGTFLDLNNGNFFSPNLFINARRNEAFFKGDIYAESGYFNGTLVSSDAQLACWTIDSNAIYKGAATSSAAFSTTNAAYMGTLGFSLGDKLVYNADKDSLTLNVESIDIGGQDLNTAIAITKDGDSIYYGSIIPTDQNTPYTSWLADGEGLDRHIGNLYYDTTTGKVYRFTNKSQYPPHYRINFSAQSNIRPNDYIYIYYTFNNVVYRVQTRITGNNIEPVVIPTNRFYLFWHIEQGMASEGLYGFSIQSIETVGSTVELSGALNSNRPSGAPESLTVGVYPETEHPYRDEDVQRDINKIWFVKIAVTNNNYFEWVEIENQELIQTTRNALKALSYLHYDLINGLIVHNGFFHDNTIPMLDGETWTNTELNNIVDGNARFTTQGIDIYKGNTLVAHYGENTILYGPEMNAVNLATARYEPKLYLGKDGIEIRNGALMLGYYQAEAEEGHENEAFHDYLVKFFDNGFFIIGDDSNREDSPTNGSYIKFQADDDNPGQVQFIINADSISIGKDDVATGISNAQSSADTANNNFANFMTDVSNAIQWQIDGKAQTWKQADPPDQTENWVDTSTPSSSDLKRDHAEDIWFETDTGKYYSYKLNNTLGTYTWVELNTVPALLKTAINKGAEVFTTTSNTLPQPPYKKGDMWLNATFTYMSTSYTNEIMICVNSKRKGQAASGGDWALASKYTDDTRANEVGDVLKGNMQWRYYGTPTNGTYPAVNWTTTEEKLMHLGNICFDDKTGKTYVYTKTGLIVKFSQDSRTQGVSYDWVQIFYEIDGKTYSLPKLGGSNISGAEQYVPASSFYLNWRTNSSNNAYYGFKIDSITVNGLGTSSNTLATKPNVSLTSYSTLYPESQHNGYSGNLNQLFYYDSRVGDFCWTEVQDIDILTAATTATNFAYQSNTYGLVMSNHRILTDAEVAALQDPHIRLNTTGLNIYLGQNLVATYGENTIFYKYGTNEQAAILNSNGLQIKSGNLDGITIDDNAIYANGKNSSTSNAQGFYLNSSGEMNIGDENNYMRFYKPANQSSYVFKISVGGIDLETKLSTLTTDFGDMSSRIGNLSDLVDKKIETFVSSSDPSDSWSNSTMKELHVGDMWHDTSNDLYKIYTKSGSTYSWSEMNALSSSMKTTINNKSVVFTSSSTPTGMKTGDLWFQGSDYPIKTYNGSNWVVYNNEGGTATKYLYEDGGLIVCQNGSSYSSSPYVKLTSTGLEIYSKYVYTESGYTYTQYKKSVEYGKETKFIMYTGRKDTTGTPAATLDQNGFIVSSGTVGGITIDSTSIHVGYTSSTDTTGHQGFYFGSDGKFKIGSGDSYISYDGSSILMSFNGSTVATQSSLSSLHDELVEELEELIEDGSSSGSAADNYISTTSDGLIISQSISNYQNGTYILLSSNGLDLYSSSTAVCGSIGTNGTLTMTYINCIENLSAGAIGGSTISDRDENRTAVTFTSDTDYIDLLSGARLYNRTTAYEILCYNKTSYRSRGTAGAYYGKYAISLCGSANDDCIEFNNGRMRMTHFNGGSMKYTFLWGYDTSDNDDSGKIRLMANDETTIYAYLPAGYLEVKSFNNNSDERKKNILGNYDCKDLFMSIKPISYIWNDIPDENVHFGVGAQTLQKSINKLGYDDLSLVTYNPDDDRYSVNYIELLMLSVPVVQSHEQQIQDLQQQVSDLQAEIFELRKKVK